MTAKRGGRQLHNAGYIMLHQPTHQRADKRGRVYEHIVVAERALGHPLPLRARIHHINRQRGDNRNTNLVICENHAYHIFLHRRMRAYQATGSANAIKCVFCKQWGFDGLNDMTLINRSNGMTGHAQHNSCQRSYRAKNSGTGPAARTAHGARIAEGFAKKRDVGCR